MERFRNNKENVSSNPRISNIFKVKKCLFDQTLLNKKTELCSNSGQQPMELSPIPQTFSFEDSPYSLFKVKKKRTTTIQSNISCSTNGSPYGKIVTTPTNKKFIKEKDVNKKEQLFDSPQSYESSTNIKLAVQKSMLNPDLIGDFTKPCILPTVRGRHPDLKSISSETMADLLRRSESMKVSLIDCRYPYEFLAGHIQTAQNIYMKEDVVPSLLDKTKIVEKKGLNQVVIFYCEFSSERGPKMLRYLRSMDRDMNRDCYPYLHYPELYILEGGYKEFHSKYKELCEPQNYRKMLDEGYSKQLAHFKSECKLRSRRSKCPRRACSSLMFSSCGQ